jgi:hypothetical protein
LSAGRSNAHNTDHHHQGNKPAASEPMDDHNTPPCVYATLHVRAENGL